MAPHNARAASWYRQLFAEGLRDVYLEAWARWVGWAAVVAVGDTGGAGLGLPDSLRHQTELCCHSGIQPLHKMHNYAHYSADCRPGVPCDAAEQAAFPLVHTWLPSPSTAHQELPSRQLLQFRRGAPTKILAFPVESTACCVTFGIDVSRATPAALSVTSLALRSSVSSESAYRWRVRRHCVS